MAKKAALYLRSSKDRHEVSIDSQRRELTRHVQEHGNFIVAEFIDKVESAKTDDRPGFQSMIEEVKSNGCRFSVLYCYDTSRFSRRQYHAQIYKHVLKKHNIELRFLKLPKTDTILDPIIESLMETFDEFHSQKSKADGLRGMRENIEQGWRAGGRPILGYKLDKHVVGTRDGQPITKSKLAADPRMFPLIQQYLKSRALGESRKALIKSLNLSVPYTSLAYIEESALTYAGHTVWNRHNEYVDGKYVGGKKYRDRSEWVIKNNTHEAMISDIEAETILKQLEKQRKNRKRFRRNNYLLSGLIQCACGANIDGDAGYYRCHVRCGRRSIKKERLEEALLSLLFNEFLTPENILELREEIEEEYLKNSKGNRHILDQLEKELRDTRRQISELVKLLPQVNHQRPLLEQLDILEEERVSLDDELQKQKDTAEPTLLRLNDEALDTFLEQYRTNLESGEPEKRKAILRSIIDHGIFDGETLKIIPSYENVTGVNMASPRGFEPLLPP